jgi:hypothetical protein
MESHLTAVAALRIGYNTLGVIFGLIILTVLATIGAITHDEDANIILSIVGFVVGGGLIVLSIPGIIGGIGLLKHKEWARILVLILSAMDLINIPIGTAVGVYSIWVLVQDETAILFRTKPETTPTSGPALA